MTTLNFERLIKFERNYIATIVVTTRVRQFNAELTLRTQRITKTVEAGSVVFVLLLNCPRLTFTIDSIINTYRTLHLFDA